MSLVEYDCIGDVGRLILNRPEAGNAINPELISEFGRAVDEASASPVRALLIMANGANFSLGGDVHYLAAAGSAVADSLFDMATRFHAAQRRLCALPIPILAAVRGNAIGAGFGLALAADFLICADTARFSAGYSRLGLSADAGVSYFLTRALGARRATAFLIDSRFVCAHEAIDLGIADRSVSESDLDAEAQRWVQELASGPTAAFAAIKRLTNESRTNTLDQHLDRELDEIVGIARRYDVNSALLAVIEHRAPTFRNA